jgi:CheY-like chemotaxis protein
MPNTTFSPSLRLPLPDDRMPLERPTVLLVNDTPDLRRLKRLVLEDAGHGVVEALDGQVALMYLRGSTAPLVVVMNTRIPTVDAAGILRTAATELLLKRHAYILTTALARQLPDELGQLAYDLQVQVIGKPFSQEDLLAAVAQAIQRLQTGNEGGSL